MSSDITQYVYKENDESSVFFVDTEDYTNSGQHLQGYEDGDMVKWRWQGARYSGTLRNLTGGLFIVNDAKKL